MNDACDLCGDNLADHPQGVSAELFSDLCNAIERAVFGPNGLGYHDYPEGINVTSAQSRAAAKAVCDVLGLEL